MSDFHTLVGKAIAEPSFAEALVKDPKPTLAEIGIEPTDEMLKALQEVDVEAMKRLAVAFGDDKAAV
jgi:hypothetical protein